MPKPKLTSCIVIEEFYAFLFEVEFSIAMVDLEREIVFIRALLSYIFCDIVLEVVFCIRSIFFFHI